MYSRVVLHCDGYLDLRSFQQYKVDKDVQRLAQAMAVQPEERDPDKNYFRRPKPQPPTIEAQPMQTAGVSAVIPTPAEVSAPVAPISPTTPSVSSQEESEDEYTSSGFSDSSWSGEESSDSERKNALVAEARRKAEQQEFEQMQRDHATYTKFVRFLAVARQLPLEIQMVLCNYAYDVNQAIIRSSLAEHAFRHVIAVYDTD